MDGIINDKIVEAVVLPENNGITLFFQREHISIEVVDKDKSVYLYNKRKYVAPARAIHNFEIIQRVNNTGELNLL